MALSTSLPSLLFLLLLSNAVLIHCQRCKPSGNLIGTSGRCNQGNGAECCKAGVPYPRYRCSPPVTGATKARMTINDFSAGGDGGGPSQCDGKYHSNKEKIVALSTGWYNNGSRCGKKIRISANGCDSFHGCDEEHGFQPPCHRNIVDASRAVWKALEIPESQIGYYRVTWSDA